MTRGERIQHLFHLAADLPPHQRHAFLLRECPEADLREEVLGLLALDQPSTDGPWNRSALDSLAANQRAEGDPLLGRRLGAYRITALIARGGMGKVYRAERDDDAYRQSVAVKLIRYGLDSEETAARFRFERQILASLNHPNIARLLDGGADENGLPYLVMEFVEGQPVTEYCQQRQLPLRARLQLFQQICAAVQYAHERMVIHRDLKPGNILVTAEGTPKLLDFGIAKLAGPADASPATITGMRLLTPRYASPEQIAQETVTTASDVYSLGVVLYEMLTGQSPYRSNAETLQALVRDVCELEPVKPSERQRQLRGDLDNILLMALRKDPKRRYALALQLSADIGRFLAGSPVQARGDALPYVASKFVRRHWLATSLAGALLAGLFATGFVAYQAQSRAARRFNDVRTLANSMLFEVHDNLGKYPGTLEARRVLVRRAHQYLDALAREDADQELLLELAAAYSRLGSLTNDVAHSLAIHQKALALSQRLHAADPANLRYLRQLSDSEGWVGNKLRQQGDLANSTAHHLRQVALAEELTQRENSRENREFLAEAYSSLSPNLVRQGNLQGAFDVQNKALLLNQSLAAEQPGSDVQKRNVVISTIMRAVALSDLGQWQQAAEQDRQCVRAAAALLAKEPDNPTYRRDLWLANEHLAIVLEKGQQYQEALQAIDRGLPLLEELYRADQGDFGHIRGLAVSYLAKGRMLAQLGRWSEANLAVQHAVTISRPQLTSAVNPFESRHDVARGCLQLASIRLGSLPNRSTERAATPALAAAESLLAESDAHYQTLSGQDPQNLLLWRDRAELDATWGDLWTLRQNWPRAAQRYRSAAAHWLRVERAGGLRECDRPKATAVQQNLLRLAGSQSANQPIQ